MGDSFDKDLLRQYMMGAASPTNGSKYSRLPDVIDLHLDPNHLKNGKVGDQHAIEHQLSFFEKAIDTALTQNKSELRIVHGIGKGKLKSAIHQYLKKHPHVSSFDDSYHHKYGDGSTLVYFL